jgi:hypothetical protein
MELQHIAFEQRDAVYQQSMRMVPRFALVHHSFDRLGANVSDTEELLKKQLTANASTPKCRNSFIACSPLGQGTLNMGTDNHFKNLKSIASLNTPL